MIALAAARFRTGRVLMRIILTVIAMEILRLPYLKLIGAALFLWIGAPEGDDEEAMAGRRRCWPTWC